MTIRMLLKNEPWNVCPGHCFNVGSIIGAGIGLIGASKSAKASKSAANQEYASAMAAVDEDRRQYDQSRTDSEPWRKAGGSAVDEMSRLLGIGGDAASSGYGSLAKPFSMADYQADPGYAFRLQEAQKAIERGASAKGMLKSGAALKALDRYSQDYASNEYASAYDRFNQNQTNLYNRLAGVSGTGQTANSNLASIGQQTAQSIGGHLTDGGSAKAAGTVGASNAWSSGLQGIGNTVQDYFAKNPWIIN